MTDLSAHAILARNKTTLKETSCNDQSPNNPYMTNSSLEVINFDAVKTEYVDSLHLSEVPKSNDALLQKKDGSLVFVEFKGYCFREVATLTTDEFEEYLKTKFSETR